MKNNVKAIIGEFINKTGSNSVLDFAVWLDCRTEYANEIERQHMKLRQMEKQNE